MPTSGRFAGVSLPAPAWAGDRGEVPVEVAEALTAYAGEPDDPCRRVAALAALARSRVLVAVTSAAGEVAHDAAGLVAEKDSEMAVVLTRGRDGRLALPAFTGLDRLTAWHPRARPVPVPTRLAAAAAIQDDAAALVVDLASPWRLVVAGRELAALAAGWMPALVGREPVWLCPSSATGPSAGGSSPTGTA